MLRHDREYEPEATEEQIQHVIERIKECGYQAHVIRGAERTVIGAVGSSGRRGELEALQAAPGVEALVPISQPFKLVSRELHRERTVVNVGGVPIGGERWVVIAGPCSVESREQLLETARGVRDAGASLLRGGAYKPRTSPYDFQGLGVEALELLKEAREETGLPDRHRSDEHRGRGHGFGIRGHAAGGRAQHAELLRCCAGWRGPTRPVLLKRGPSATVKEWLLAAEYLLAGGNPNVVLCERGIKTFESELRNTFDLAAIALAKELSHLPVVADPSHGTGRRSVIPAMSRAAIAAGADGLMIEVHPCPERALSDGPQSLDLAAFARLMQEMDRPARPHAAAALTIGRCHAGYRPYGGVITGQPATAFARCSSCARRGPMRRKYMQESRITKATGRHIGCGLIRCFVSRRPR